MIFERPTTVQLQTRVQSGHPTDSLLLSWRWTCASHASFVRYSVSESTMRSIGVRHLEEVSPQNSLQEAVENLIAQYNDYITLLLDTFYYTGAYNSWKNFQLRYERKASNIFSEGSVLTQNLTIVAHVGSHKELGLKTLSSRAFD